MSYVKDIIVFGKENPKTRARMPDDERATDSGPAPATTRWKYCEETLLPSCLGNISKHIMKFKEILQFLSMFPCGVLIVSFDILTFS